MKRKELNLTEDNRVGLRMKSTKFSSKYSTFVFVASMKFTDGDIWWPIKM